MATHQQSSLPKKPSVETAANVIPAIGKRIHDINEPIPDPSELLSQRLDNWLHAVNILYNYVETYTTLTKKSIHGYEKIKKSIATLPRFTRYEGTFNENGSPSASRTNTSSGIPEGGQINVAKGPNRTFGGSRTSTIGSSEIVLGALNSPGYSSGKEREAKDDALPSYSDTSNQPTLSAQQKAFLEDSEFAPHNRGIDGLFELLRVKNDMNLASAQNLDKQVKEQVLPAFKELTGEISTHKKKFNNTVDKNNKTLAKITKAKSKLIAELENSIQIYNEASSNSLKSSTGQLSDIQINYEKDPFLVKKLFFKNLNEEFKNENSIIEQLIYLKEDIFTLEIKIISSIKKLIILFNNFQINHFEEVINNFLVSNQEFSLFDENFEISKFLSSHLEADGSQATSERAIHKREDLLLLLSSKLPNDNNLIQANLEKDINYVKVEDPKLFGSVNHESTIPILRDLITYQEIRKMSLKDKLQKNHFKNDYFALTKSKYLFVFGTENEVTTSSASNKAHELTSSTNPKEKSLTATDKDFLKGELEPSLIFYLPRCSVIDDEDTTNNASLSDESYTAAPEPGITRSNTFKSKFGSFRKKKHSDSARGLAEREYLLKFVGVDLNHRILNKFSHNAHKRTIVMKFHSKDQFQLWNNIIRETSGGLQELAEDFDEKLGVPVGAAADAGNAGAADTATDAEIRNSSIGSGATEYDSASEIAPGTAGAAGTATTAAPGTTAVEDPTPNTIQPQDTSAAHPAESQTVGQDLSSDHLNENFQNMNIKQNVEPAAGGAAAGTVPVARTTSANTSVQSGTVPGADVNRSSTLPEGASDDDLSEAGVESIHDLRAAIKKDKDKEALAQQRGHGTFVEDPSSIS